jgi:outer membrane protein assembly factor BamB
VRWSRSAWRGVALGLLLGMCVVTWQAADAEVWQRLANGLGAMLWLVPVGLACLGLLLWLLVFSKIDRRVRFCLGGAALLLGGGAAALLRFDSFSGSLVPQFAWRWSPAAGQGVALFPIDPSGSPSGDAATDADSEAGADDGSVDRMSVSKHDYPGFLGADRTGMIDNVRLARDWDRRPPRELWRHPVGMGWSGFALAGECAVTQEQRGSDETVVCYELRTGRERWVHRDATLFTGAGIHGDGPRATPTIHRGRVYALGATGFLNCLDGSSGRLLWQSKVLPDPGKDNLVWGMAGSPLVVDGKVIVSPGIRPGRSVMAFDLESGQPVWSAGDDPAAYSSPQYVHLGGEPQILVFNGAGLAAHNPTSGRPLWNFPWVTQGVSMVNVAQPLILTGAALGTRNDAVLISSGYGEGCALLMIRQGPDGRVVNEIWRNKLLKSKFSNVVSRGPFVYGLDDGVLVCLEAQGGKRRWKQGRYGHGQLLLAGDLLLVQAESGDVVLVEPSPDALHELGRLSALSSKTWNHPALAGSLLVVRNDREAACFELPPVEGRGE